MKTGYISPFARLLALALGACAQCSWAYDVRQAAEETGLSETLIEAIALEESQRPTPGSAPQPWAWTLNANGRPLYFDTRAQAEEALRELRRAGVRNIDVGIFQVNIRWNGDLVEDPVHLLDPAVNLWAFTQVVLECQARLGTQVRRVLACYHAGSHERPHGVAYAQRVIERYRSLQWGYQP